MGVYVIGHDPNGPVKIGKSVDARQRLSSLQGGSINKLQIFYFGMYGHESSKLEAAVHLRLKEYRVAGEWFNVSSEFAKTTIIETYKETVPEHLQQIIKDLNSVGRMRW